MSHAGLHEYLEAERKKQLTDKERATLKSLFFYASGVLGGDRDVVTFLQLFCPVDLTAEEAAALKEKIGL